MKKLPGIMLFVFLGSALFAQDRPGKVATINLLNYIATEACLTQHHMEDSLLLEDIYNRLENSIEPGLLDEAARNEFLRLFNRITNFQVQDIQRERIRYLRDHAKAQAVQRAIPSPVFFLSLTQNLHDPLAFAINLVGMTAQSVTGYLNATEKADLKFYEENSKLEEKQKRELNGLRSSMFNYMSTVARANGLRDNDTVSRADIDKFLNLKKERNIVLRLENLERNRAVYEKYYPYWLELANSYYEAQKYRECILAIQQYEAIQTPLYRSNHNTEYALTLSKGIYALQEIYKNDRRAYKARCLDYLRKIERNTPDEEWSIRFTAAMAYLDLASGNDNDRQDMLDRAYRLLWGNVANLAQRQSALINDYFTPIREPQNADKQQKQAYQRLKKAREKELPPLDVPFYTNYYALTGVMDLLNIGEQERHTLDAIVRDATIILHARRNYVGFSTEEDWYLYNCSDTQMSYSTFNLFSDWNYVTMPSCLLTNDARIDIEVYAGLFPWDERNEFKFVQDAFQIYREENIEWKVEKLNWERLTWEELILEGLIREGPEFEKYIREELKGNVNIDFRMFKHAKNARGEYIFMDMTEQTVKLAVRPKQQIKDNFDKFIIEFIIHDAVGVYIVTFYKEKKGDATEFFGVLKVK